MTQSKSITNITHDETFENTDLKQKKPVQISDVKKKTEYLSETEYKNESESSKIENMETEDQRVVRILNGVLDELKADVTLNQFFAALNNAKVPGPKPPIRKALSAEAIKQFSMNIYLKCMIEEEINKSQIQKIWSRINNKNLIFFQKL